MTEPARKYTVSPYEPPDSARDPRPAVILWFRIYSATIGVLALAVTGVWLYGIFLSTQADIFDPATGKSIVDQSMQVPVGLLLAASSLLHLVGAFAPYKPWGWTLGI